MTISYWKGMGWFSHGRQTGVMRPKADDVSWASAILSSRPSKGWFYWHWPLFSSQQPLKPPEGGFGCLRLPSCLAGQLCRKHLYFLDGRRLGE